MLFGSGKDTEDIKNILQVQKEQVDREYIRRWVIAESDEARVKLWDEICKSITY